MDAAGSRGRRGNRRGWLARGYQGGRGVRGGGPEGVVILGQGSFAGRRRGGRLRRRGQDPVDEERDVQLAQTAVGTQGDFQVSQVVPGRIAAKRRALVGEHGQVAHPVQRHIEQFGRLLGGVG